MLPSKKTASDFPFKHTGNADKYGQSLGGDYAQVQTNFDARALYNQTQINALLDALASVSDGDSGANNVAITAILGVTGGNVQEALEGIKSYVDSTIGEIVIGQIVDNSLTNAKLAVDIKVGSLSDLDTTDKTSVTNAINELFNGKLGATAKATDSDKLDGKDSTEFVLSSDTTYFKETNYGNVLSSKTVSFTLALTESNKIIPMAGSVQQTITIPPNSSVEFPIGTQIVVIMQGAGSVIFAPASGVTLVSKDTKRTIDGQYASATLIKTSTDGWNLIGALKA